MLLTTTQKIKTLFAVFTVAFVLNLIWENAQAPLYQGYTSFGQHFWICLPASLWDAGYITIVYLLFTLTTHEWNVIQKSPDQDKSVSWIIMLLPAVLGLVTATIIELRALSEGRWAYTAAMPIVPIIHVGATPFLQLAILSLATYTIVAHYERKKISHSPHL